jgi:hypothetical protein
MAEAAAACGLNKTTVLRAIKAGKKPSLGLLFISARRAFFRLHDLGWLGLDPAAAPLRAFRHVRAAD